MFGINGGEFIVLLVIAAIVIGPERLPGYAEQFADFVRSARAMFTSAKDGLGELSKALNPKGTGTGAAAAATLAGLGGLSGLAATVGGAPRASAGGPAAPAGGPATGERGAGGTGTDGAAPDNGYAGAPFDDEAT